MNKKNESGRSIVEVVGVLALGALAIVAVLKVYDKNDKKVKMTKTMYNISELADSVKTLYWGKNSYEGILNTTLATKGVEAKFLRDAYGNNFTLSSVSPFTSYTITITGITDDKECYTYVEKKIEGMDAGTTHTCTDPDVKTVTYTFN